MRKRLSSISACVVLMLMIIFSAFQCSPKKERTDAELAVQACGACHAFPEPSLLPKAIWRDKVLPAMAFRMGLTTPMEELIKLNTHERQTVISSIPSKPMLTEEEWQSILKYYLAMAPDSLTLPSPKQLPHTDQFDGITKLPDAVFPSMTMIDYDSVSKTIVAGSREGELHVLSNEFKTIDHISTSAPVSDIKFFNDYSEMLTMGNMDPNDQYGGSLIKMTNNGHEISVIIDSLRRPVHFEKFDFDNNGKDDYVICAFGNYTGDLSVYQNLGNGEFKKHILSGVPGARCVQLRDLNHDGLQDITALMTQGKEQILTFINKGSFQFEQKVLAEFPPVYGSSYFEFADFNHDSKIDLLYSNGDNADFSPVLKPYHGIRVFLNDGNNSFKEHFFQHMYGASKAVALDFDEDGDNDILAISFFPDFDRSPEESILYLKNDNGVFHPFTVPFSNTGRWLVLKTLDVDGDGDQDAIIGALDLKRGLTKAVAEQWLKQPTTLLFLKNKLR